MRGLMAIASADDEHLGQAAALLRAGGVVAMPTETVYGLAADALNPRACATIFEVKGRPRFDPLIVHVADAAMLEQVCTAAALRDARVTALAQRFWPGPLTVVLPKCEAIPDIVTAGLATVAVRVPAHPVARELIRRVGRPLAAPSANRFGCLSPTTAAHVQAQLGDRIPLILDGGPCAIGVESTIVDLSRPDAPPRVLRPGGITMEALAQTLADLDAASTPPASERRLHNPAGQAGPETGWAVEGPGPGRMANTRTFAKPQVRLVPTGDGTVSGDDPTAAPMAPGQLASHYAPHTPLRLLDQDADVLAALRATASTHPGAPPRVGLLTLRPPAAAVVARAFAVVEVLSSSGDLREAAANLFAALHRLDAAELDLILAPAVAEAGLGRAIMDRLRRGCALASR
jgi:L-threonylcarbamoyladenylate synthase